MLSGLGGVVEPGRFAITLESEQNTVVLNDRRLALVSKAADGARVEITGRADLDDAGRFVPRGGGTLESAVADGAIDFNSRIGLDANAQPHGTLELRARVDLDDSELIDLARRQARLAVEGSKSDRELELDAKLKIEQGEQTLSGRFRVDAATGFAIQRRQGPLVGEFEGRATIQGEGTFSQRSGQPLEVDAPLRVELDPQRARGVLSQNGDSPEIPVRLRGADSMIVGDLNLRLAGDRVLIEDSAVEGSLRFDVKQPNLEARDLELVFDGDVLVAGRGRLRFDPEQGLRLDHGEVSVRFGVENGRVDNDELTLDLGAGSSVTTRVRGLQIGPNGLRAQSTDSAFEFVLTGERARLGLMELVLDPNNISTIRGQTDLYRFTGGGRLIAGERGAGVISLELHTREIRAVDDDRFAFGPGAKTLHGDAVLEIGPERIRVLEGKLSADMDLRGTTVDR